MPPGDIYARVFENAQTGLLLLEKVTGRILQANAAFLRMAARDCAEVAGRSFWAPPLIADADAGAEIHGHLLAGGTVVGVELPLQAGDGRWLLLEVSGKAANGAIQLEVRDATEREQARLAERLETLRLQAARTAAEFRNLHGALLTMGELLLVSRSKPRPARTWRIGKDPPVQRARQRDRRTLAGIQRRDRTARPAGRPQRSCGKHAAQVAPAIRAAYRNCSRSEPRDGARNSRSSAGAPDHLEAGDQFVGSDGGRRRLLSADRQRHNHRARAGERRGGRRSLWGAGSKR